MYVGLDPYIGLCHGERYGKPALVLDMVEEFRVPAIDSAIFQLFLDKKLSALHFNRVARGEYELSEEGKRVLVEAVFNRLNQEVLWRGKRYSLKKAMENQIRQLARYFLGKEKGYRPFSLSQMRGFGK